MGFFNVELGDVATGVALGLEEGIQTSIDQYQKNKERLRDITYTTEKAKYDKFTNEVDANRKKIEEAAAVFGGNMDAIYSLIESEGSLDAAVEAANMLKKQEQTLGISPLETLGLAEGSASGVTASQLAKYTATPISVGKAAKPEDVATGFMSFIPGAGERAVERIETGVRADLAAAGYEDMGSREEILSSMPEATANKLKPYMLGRVADPQAEMNRLINVQASLYAQGKKDEADAVKNEVTRLAGVVTMTEKDNYTPNLSIATKGNIEQLISSKYALGGEYNAQGAWMSAHNDRQVVVELDRVGSYAEGFIDEAVSDGMGYGLATRKVNEFIRDNKNFVYIPNPDGFGPGEFREAEGVLFNTGLIGAAAEDVGVVDQSTTDEAEVGDPATAGSTNQGAVDAEVARLQQMDPNSTEAKALRAKILRSERGAERLAEAGL